MTIDIPGQSNMSPAQLIDPEDIAINFNINKRGYTVRCSVYRGFSLIKPHWRQWVEDHSDHALLISVDRKEFNGVYEDVGTYVYDMGDKLLVIYVPSNRDVYFHVWSTEYSIANAVCEQIISELFCEKVIDVMDEETHTREITFWASVGGDYNPFHRRTTLLPWNDEMRINYPAKQLDTLDTLMNLQPPIFGGKIIIMHGPPGSGKTSLIRALSRKWTKWCHTSYITDPEIFLGNSGAVLTVATWRYESYISNDVPAENAYHLLVIEDADELIAADAKLRTGQALSRLLNLGDGVLGQSTNLLICLTTNVHMKDLHEAVSRPGRCLANIEFENFSYEEAKGWLSAHGATEDELRGIENRPYSLAELYQVGKDFAQVKFAAESIDYRAGVYI